MDFKAILKKMLAGEELSAEEKAFMESYDPAKDKDKIPKTRLDAEITKRKEFEKQVKELNSTVEEIQEKLDSKDEKDLSEMEKLTKAHDKEKKALEKKVTDLTGERDTSKTELSGMKFNGSVTKLAAKHGFNDAEYLGYLVKQKGEDFDLENETGVTDFMDGLKKESPKLFTVDTKSGAGSGEGGEKVDNEKFVEAKNKGDINSMLENAPEIE